MAKVNSLFEEFLKNIEPDDNAVGYAMDAHHPVREFLETDEDFKEYFEDSFLYGSYKRQTATGDIKDIDIVIVTNFDPESDEHTPQKVLKKLKKVLAKYYNDPENPEYQRRSIRINEPLPDDADTEMTLDIIPAVPSGDDTDILLVPDRETKEWIQTNPKGHIDYVHELNDKNYSKGSFVPLAKIIRWWWKYQSSIVQPEVERPKPKGFWVECLTAENFNPSAASWADHFIDTLTNISEKYSGVDEIPSLTDPGLSEQEIKTNMTQEEFQKFMDTLNVSLAVARQAYAEQDEKKSSELWKEIFGEEFPVATKTVQEIASKAIRVREANEQFIEDFGITPIQTRYRLYIDATVVQDGFRPFSLRGAYNYLRKKRSLSFFIDKMKTNIPSDVDIFWKVKNKGEEASERGQLRGEITRDKGNWSKGESTAYEGTHYVECYAVVGDKCIAIDRIDVPIGGM